MVKTSLLPRALRLPFLATALIALAAAPSAFAQSIRWNLPDLNLSQGKVSQISLVFENCSPQGDFKIPKVEGLDDFGNPVGRQSTTQMQMNNFKMQKLEKTFFSYLITPLRKGRIEIPSFDIETNKGKLRVPALSLDIEEGRASALQQSGNELLSTSLETTASTVWQGQIFPLRYEVLLMVNERANLAGDPNKWKPSELVMEDWPQYQVTRRNVDGTIRRGLLFQTQAYAPKAGNLETPPLEMEAEIETGRSFGFFAQSQTERISLKSNPLKLTVKELPQPAPASFTGAVGQFRLESKLTQTEISAGQPVTWTLTLKGTGNWPDNFKLPGRQVPAQLRVIQPEAKRENVPGKMFEASLTEDVVLIPDKAGNIELPPVQFTYFNPEKGAYETLSTEAATLTVNPDPHGSTASRPSVGTAPAPGAPLYDNVNPARPKTEADLSKPLLPRDPIPGHSSSFAPLHSVVVVAASTALIFSLLPFWLLLARRHSVKTSAVTKQRLAMKEAFESLAKIDSCQEPAARKNLLLRWQHLVAQGFALEQATPSHRQLEQSANPHLSEEWLQLWQESDAALYSAQPELPSDWSNRARQAYAKLRLGKVPLHQTFLPKHLFPLVLAFLALAAAPAQAADPALEAYQKGDFASAQKDWQKESDQNPGDWITHNNLGLAFSQQKEWGPAVAEWASAFLHQPRHPDVAWNLALGLSHLDNRIPELEYLQQPEILPTLARQLSPFQWQFLALASVLTAVAAAAFMLARRYQNQARPSALFTWLPVSAVTLGLVAFVLSLTALRAYGTLGDARAGIIISKAELKSVPTDAESKQAQREINPGLVVLAEKPFLGWWKVRLANNETGWVRQENLHRLYY